MEIFTKIKLPYNVLIVVRKGNTTNVVVSGQLTTIVTNAVHTTKFREVLVNTVNSGSSSSLVQRVTAPIAIGGHRLVWLSTPIELIESLPLDKIKYKIGLTTNAAVMGGSIDILTIGSIIEPSWAFSIGPVYIDTNGNITQNVPISGVILKIGTALTPNTLFFNPSEPLILA